MNGKTPDSPVVDHEIVPSFATDISVTLKGKERPGKRWSGEWNLSVYNAYARKNVWTLNFVQDEAQPDLTYAEMTYLFSVIPAITYNFKF